MIPRLVPRRPIAKGLLLAVLLGGAGSLQAAPQQTDAGDFKLVFVPSADPDLDVYRVMALESGIFQAVIDGLNDLLTLPYDINIRFEDKSEGPYYRARTIIMNYPFMKFHGELFVGFEYSEDAQQFADDVLGLTEFVLYHEIGHALVDAYKIPILGREEDAADSLAAMLAARLDAGEIALVAADAFDMQVAFKDEIADQEFWDSHSLNEQRMFTLACLIYGSDPEQYAGLFRDMELPAEQEPRCISEFQEKFQSWFAVLSPHIKAQ